MKNRDNLKKKIALTQENKDKMALEVLTSFKNLSDKYKDRENS